MGQLLSRTALTLIALLGAAAPAVRAEDGPPRPPRAAPGAPAQPIDPASAVHPPELLEFAEAEYPTDAAASGLEGSVVLELTLDAEGAVTEARIAEGAGHGFDEAALEAASRFRFSPARRGETPVPSRIRYAYEFRLPPPPPEGTIAGRVLLWGAGDPPAVGAEVAAADPGGRTFATRTDGEGSFRLEGLPAGAYRLRAEAAGAGAIELALAVAAGEVAEPVLRILPAETEGPIDVTVRGESEAERLRESAQAVHVIETEEAQRQTADLGEVLARSQGVNVRRGGGLGSGTRFSLNGLTDDQIRFFLDGVPLDLAGYPFGIANVPVNLVERVEVYRGVVPVRFGADALGGAVNLVSDEDVRGTHGSLSWQAGAFGTQRLAASGRRLHEPSGLFVRFSGFLDQADNDFEIDVEVADPLGRLSPARVHRFHDGYRAGGAHLEVGLVERPWAKRLLLRGFFTEYGKELQHNVVMTVPYGEVEYGERTTGATLRYEHLVGERLTVDAVGGWAYGETRLLDVGTCVYDWYGRCVRARRQPGEMESRPRDQIVWEHGAFARVGAGWRLHPQHAVRVSLSPTYTTRTGDERRQADPTARDPLAAERDLLTVVTGVEWEVDLLSDRLENVAFAKDYLQRARSEEALPGGVFASRARDTRRAGAGNALRYRFAEWLYAKASYEWATRLPRPDEIFGDALLVVESLQLRPETSHNVNLGATATAPGTPTGSWHLDVNGFLREAADLIVLLGNDRVFSYQNVFSARSLGVEAAAGWSSPGEVLALDGNVTVQDFRNTSRDGTFGAFEGDRIPNRPWLLANGSARLQRRGVAAPDDELALVWNVRYVHEFFRGWESVGLREFKQVVPSQLLHSAALTYLVRGPRVTLGFTGEVQNLTDAPAYDFFGVQRPGRGLYFKTTAQF